MTLLYMILISMSWGILYDMEIWPKVNLLAIAASIDTETFLSLTSFYSIFQTLCMMK